MRRRLPGGRGTDAGLRRAASGNAHGMPSKKEDLPSTLERSPRKVQRTYEEALDSAHETYEGNEQRAHRTAWSAVKHVAEKKGDHWEPKDGKGPSDAQAAKSGAEARRGGPTAGGVDASKSKSELYEDAKRAGIEGRSSMTKDELVDALRKSNDRATARARS
jgi:cation transport regulator ChaB